MNMPTKNKGGRPTVASTTPELLNALYEVLPTLHDEKITVSEAARQLDVSRRTLRRYIERLGDLCRRCDPAGHCFQCGHYNVEVSPSVRAEYVERYGKGPRREPEFNYLWQ